MCCSGKRFDAISGIFEGGEREAIFLGEDLFLELLGTSITQFLIIKFNVLSFYYLMIVISVPRMLPMASASFIILLKKKRYPFHFFRKHQCNIY